MALRVRHHENRVADFLEVADLRNLLAGDVREVARAEVGIEPKLEDEHARLVGGHGGLQGVERGGLAETLERRLAVLHVHLEFSLVAVLVLCEVEVRGSLLQLELPDIRLGLEPVIEQRQQCVVASEHLGLDLRFTALGVGLLLDLRRTP